MNAMLNSTGPNLMPLSLRIARLMLSTLLVIAIATELSLSSFWKLMLSTLALYTFATGVFGRDPLFDVLRLSIRQLPNHALGIVAQLECLTIGSICFVAGIINHNADSLVLPLLPFFGVYPILLWVVKYDLLGYLLQSYRTDMHRKKTTPKWTFPISKGIC